MPLTLIGEAVFARSLSALKEERVKLRKVYKKNPRLFALDKDEAIDNIRKALYVSKITSYAQGYMLMQQRDAAVQQFPLAQRAPGLVDNLIQAGFDPMDAAQAVHEQVRTIAQSLAPEIASRMNQTKRAPQPMGNGQAARMAPTGGGNGQQRTSLGSLLGITRGRGTL